jgi:hypothetical protein
MNMIASSIEMSRSTSEGKMIPSPRTSKHLIHNSSSNDGNNDSNPPTSIPVASTTSIITTSQSQNCCIFPKYSYFYKPMISDYIEVKANHKPSTSIMFNKLRMTQKVKVHQGPIWCIKFSHDGNQIVILYK